MDFISNYFECRKDTLTEKELEILESIKTKKDMIKKEYPKINS